MRRLSTSKLRRTQDHPAKEKREGEREEEKGDENR